MDRDTVIDAFITDVKAILADEGPTDAGLARVAERMRAITAEPSLTETPEEFGNAHDGKGRQSRPLYTDETGLTLVRARFPSETNTPIHNHGTWGIIAVYAGVDRLQEYRRLDSGDGEGYAEIELAAEHVLRPGDTAIIPHPPQDIHAQQGGEGTAALEFVLFGKNAMEIPRLYFDPAAKTAQYRQMRHNYQREAAGRTA
jgi:predicted metal-dependent enzyme (double-stranded beta helix superfamily)